MTFDAAAFDAALLAYSKIEIAPNGPEQTIVFDTPIRLY